MSGYVVAYWKDAECSSSNFKFSPNWQAYSYSNIASYPSYTCTYNQWTADKAAGGTSNDLGCLNNPPALTFLSGGGVTPDANSAAIPYITANPKADLQAMIQQPSQEFPNSGYTNTVPGESCLHYVYFPSSQGSYTKTVDNNNDIYGVIIWALNSASDSTYSIPNYSLAHSNIFYVRGVNFTLASLMKDAALSKKPDCFVVTAASGNPNSRAVFRRRMVGLLHRCRRAGGEKYEGDAAAQSGC